MEPIKSIFKAPYNFFLKKNEFPRFIPESGGVGKKYSKFQCRLYQIKGMFIKHNQKRHYDSLAVQPDYSVPYIYLALHSEAKRTTNPAGGYFADQKLILEMLLSLMPEDWFIYIKEHPVQLDVRENSQRPRINGYYDEFEVSKRVKFIRLEEIPFNLIDNARAVTTICGNPGWEAVNRGVPALVFGDAWYAGCEGVFRILNYEDCKRALKTIQEDYQVDVKKVKKFWFAIDKCTSRGSVSISNRKEYGIDYEENVSILADLLSKKINNDKNEGPI